MNDNIRNIELVKKSYEELQDEVIKLTTDKFILQSNWNSLREYIEKQREYYRYFKDNRYRRFLTELVDKMNELEGKDRE